MAMSSVLWSRKGTVSEVSSPAGIRGRRSQQLEVSASATSPGDKEAPSHSPHAPASSCQAALLGKRSWAPFAGNPAVPYSHHKERIQWGPLSQVAAHNHFCHQVPVPCGGEGVGPGRKALSCCCSWPTGSFGPPPQEPGSKGVRFLVYQNRFL